MLTCASLTNSGDRKVNEDSIAVQEGKNGLLCILADGLGGHGQGEVASAAAVEACRQVFEANDGDGLLQACILEAHQALLNEQRRIGRMEDIKTTLTLLHIQNSRAQWAHIGDSRIYCFRKEKLASRTLDHSVPQMLVMQGAIRERDIRGHEDRNRLTRVLGMDADPPRYEVADPVDLAGPMSFLLCSDGFWEYIEEKDMSRQLKGSSTPKDWLNNMAGIVKENGRDQNMDNYSAIAVFFR